LEELPTEQEQASPPVSTGREIFHLGRKSIAYVLGHLATRAISFLLLPLYTNALAPADYGILTLAFTFAAFSMIVFHFGIDSALLRFFTGEGRERQKQVFSTVYMTQIVVSILLSISILLAQEPLARFLLGIDRPDWIVILVAIIFMDALWAHPMHILRATGRATRYASFSMTNAAVIAGANIILLTVLKMGITGALLANLAGSTVLFLITLPTVVGNFTFRGWSQPLLKKMLRFGLPFLPAGLFTMIMELSDRYFLRWMTDMETVGLYSAGYKLGLAMLLLVGGFSLGWQPFFLERGKRDGAKEVFARITVYMVFGLSWILLTVGAWIDHLIRIPIGSFTIFGPAYWSATQIVPLILLGYLFFALYVLQLPGILLTGRTSWVMLYRASGALTKLGLNFVLIPLWGAMGAATATCVAFGTMSAVTYFFNRRFYTMPYEWGRMGRLVVLLAIGFPILLMCPNTIPRNVLLTLLIPVGFAASGGIKEEEWRWLSRMVIWG
jgi:O-antigen/teichoic acid export membrane protein